MEVEKVVVNRKRTSSKKLKINAVTHQMLQIANNNSFNSTPTNSGMFSAKRVNTINHVFELLRNRIPTFPYERRLSKIDTLHLTISYIYLLQSVMNSNLSLFDYLCRVLNELTSGLASNRMVSRPIWATSDLIVRLNWLNWNALSIEQNQTGVYLSLFNQIYELSMHCQLH